MNSKTAIVMKNITLCERCNKFRAKYFYQSHILERGDKYEFFAYCGYHMTASEIKPMFQITQDEYEETITEEFLKI